MHNKKKNTKLLYGGLALLLAVVVLGGIFVGRSDLFQGYLRAPSITDSSISPAALKVNNLRNLQNVQVVKPVATLPPAGVVQHPMYGTLPPVDVSLTTRSSFVSAVSYKYRSMNNVNLTVDQWNSYKNCFPDMVGHQHEMDVCYMFSLGLTNGYADGFFHPDNVVNRAEAAKTVVTALLNGNIHPLATTKQLYGDVPLDQWFAKYINTLAQNVKSDIKPTPSLDAPDLTKSNFFPSYAMSVARTSYWLNQF